MRDSLYAALGPVRNRQQRAFVLRTSLFGLLAGAMVGVLLGLGRIFFAWPVSLETSLGVLVGGLLLGALMGVLLRRPWHEAAAAIDEHYRLKDRSVTALEFLNRADRSDLHELQIADAANHLQQVEPDVVAPVTAPRRLTAAAALTTLAAALVLFWPLHTQQADASPAPAPEYVVTVAEQIQESLQNLEDLAEREESKELKDLVAELKRKAQEMKEPGMDEREALAKLSEMQAAVQALAAEMNTAVIDGQMQSLGSALASSTAFEGAGKALEETKLDKAAAELDKIDDIQLERNEAKALEEKLKQVAKQAGDVGLGSLGSAISDLADNVKAGKGNAKKSAKTLAKEVDKQARRRKINDLLRAQFDELQEGKCNCNSLVRGKKPQKSNSPSSSFGMSESGNTEGERTKLDSQRNMQQLTGTPGDGPSETETTSSPEARQLASRNYQERYQRARKESEAVLESEPIPLGQRQVIRKYFELIRPQNGDLNDKPAQQ